MFVKSKLNSMLGQGLIAVLVMLLTFPIGMNGLHAQGSGGNGGSSGLPPQELEKLVGPIALYPDDLVGIVLPASTNALQIVSAARFLEKHKKNPKLQPDKNWDPSVLGLLNYPEVIKIMNKDLEWTQTLGDAVVNQQQDVMNAIQSFRKKAQGVGNLKTNEKQIIIVEKEIIKIVSADPQVIYVPTYQPTTVIYTTTPVYYAPARPAYWSTGAAFFTGMFVGSAIRYGTGWRRGSVDVNRSVNISGGDRNVNVGGGNRPSQQPGGGGGPGGRGGGSTQQWKPSQSSKQRTAARTGGSPSQRPGGGGGAGGRGGASARTGQQGRGGGQQARAGSQPSRSRGNSPTGGYKSGSSARANSSRGSYSRASSGGGRSRGGGGRGGGGRSGGGRRR